MTVTTHGQTRTEFRQLVHEYYFQPHGTKTGWLAAAAQLLPGIFSFRQLVDSELVNGGGARQVVSQTHGNGNELNVVARLCRY